MLFSKSRLILSSFLLILGFFLPHVYPLAPQLVNAASKTKEKKYKKLPNIFPHQSQLDSILIPPSCLALTSLLCPQYSEYCIVDEDSRLCRFKMCSEIIPMKKGVKIILQKDQPIEKNKKTGFFSSWKKEENTIRFPTEKQQCEKREECHWNDNLYVCELHG